MTLRMEIRLFDTAWPNPSDKIVTAYQFSRSEEAHILGKAFGGMEGAFGVNIDREELFFLILKKQGRSLWEYLLRHGLTKPDIAG